MVDLAKLSAPFDPAKISWRVGSTKADKSAGLALAYIDARDVMERLDSVCGPANWQCRYPHAGQKTVCEIGIRIENEWVWKANGAGDSDVEAEKGAMSDALKRAAVVWGIGRYLYDLPNVWVDLNPAGKSYAIAPGQEWKLAKALNGVAVAAEPDAPSISERATPKAPAAKSELAIDMLSRLSGVETIGQLITLARGDEWKADVEKLSAAEYADIRAEYAARQNQFGHDRAKGRAA